MATERRRRSMAEASKNDQIGEQMREAMQSAQIRHRKSISKAADVLECAGYDEAGYSVTETQEHLNKMASAMEEARGRHRRSIARAVSGLEEPPALVPPEASSLNAGAYVFTPQKAQQSEAQQCSTW